MTTAASNPRGPKPGILVGSPRVLGSVLAGASVAAGLVGGRLAVGGHTASVIGLSALVVPILLWRRPQLGPFVVLLAALTVEQFPYEVGGRNGVITDRIPLFHGFGSAHVTPVDLLLLAVVASLVAKLPSTSLRVPRSAMTAWMLTLLGAVVLGLIVGGAHHGKLRVSLMEVRPFVYLATAYVLAATLLSSRALLRAMLWALVLSTGLKAVLGGLVYLSVRHVHPAPNAVLSHEEALFFGLFVLLTLGLWLFAIKGALRSTATTLLPIVLVADLANGRRTAWLILGVGVGAMVLVAAVVLPERRRLVVQVTMAVILVGTVYFPVYWNSSGSLVGEPVRAIRSLSSPGSREASSNLYRSQENANLKLNIREGGLLGRGFGVPIDYRLPIANIRDIDPEIAYIPHNGALYIVMRMGLLGGVAFWALLASGIISCCRLARSRDRELALIGVLVACALLGYALEGFNDQGFSLYRVALVIGSLLGVSEAARVIDRRT